jgi:hypothetical protein
VDGGSISSTGLDPSHFQRTARLHASFKQLWILRSVALASGVHRCGRHRASQLCSRAVPVLDATVPTVAVRATPTERGEEAVEHIAI